MENTAGYEGLWVTNDQFNNGHNSVYAYKGGLPVEELGKSDLSKKGGIGLLIMIGIIVAAVIVVVFIIIVVILVVKKKKNRFDDDSLTEILNNDETGGIHVLDFTY